MQHQPGKPEAGGSGAIPGPSEVTLPWGLPGSNDAPYAAHILIVDDEAHIREVLARYLTAAGFVVAEASDGAAVLEYLAGTACDLVLLDLLLPFIDGRTLCQKIRANSSIPIIMISAKTHEEDKIDGFTVGADDYVTKPFSPREVVLRVSAVLRRSAARMDGHALSHAPQSAPALPTASAYSAAPDLLVAREHPAVSDLPIEGAMQCGDLVLNPLTRRVERGNVSLELTATEFDLLHVLMLHPNQVFTRQQLLDQVWGYDYFGDASTVTVHIRRLREKIEIDPANPHFIKTVWGVGYTLQIPVRMKP